MINALEAYNITMKTLSNNKINDKIKELESAIIKQAELGKFSYEYLTEYDTFETIFNILKNNNFKITRSKRAVGIVDISWEI